MDGNLIVQSLEWLQNKWNDYLSPIVIVRKYEGGVLLLFGKYERTLHKGINWKLPWPFHEAHKCLTENETVEADITITTTDRQTLQIQVKGEYRVEDPAKWILDANDAVSNIRDLLAGFAADVCTDYSFAELNGKPVKTEIKRVVNEKLSKYGVKFSHILFSKLALTRSISLSGVALAKGPEALML